MAQSITITDNRTGNQLEIPIRNGGVAAGEWSKLLPGIWFYDPAFMATAERRKARSNEAIRRFAVCCWIVSPLLAMTRSPDPDQN